MPDETDNTDRNFKGQQKNETVCAFCRKHWVVLLPNLLGFLTACVLTAGYFVFSASLGGPLPQIITPIVVLGFTYYLHYFFFRIFNYYLQTIIITNQRLIALNQTLFFTHTRDSLDLREIQNIEIQQKGVLKTLFKYGELIITLSSAHATKVFTAVPNPEYHFRKINKTKREYIMMRQREKAGLKEPMVESPIAGSPITK